MNPALNDVTLDFATLDEIREAALASLAPEVADFLEGGAGDETTLRRNRAAFAKWALRPRVMNGLAAPSTTTTFMGLELGLPVLTAPFGVDNLFDAEGHLAVARANERAGTLSIVPEAGSFSFEAVHAASPAAAKIAQFHPLASDDNFLRVLSRVEAADYEAICITCDCPTAGWRQRNLRNRYVPPLSAVSGNYPPTPDSEINDVFGQLFELDAPVWSWEKLGRLLSGTSLPWMAKGILTPEDGVAAVEAGASALLVSNHGGRQLDGVISSLEALPAIRAAVGPSVEIALDSGVRTGSDIVKALALGADVVVLGRLAAYGLAAGGEAGVARVLELLKQELHSVLTLLGRGSIADLDESAVMPSEAP